MESLVGQFYKEDPLLLIENDRRSKHLEQRPDDPGGNILQPSGKQAPDLEQYSFYSMIMIQNDPLRE
jgi:hypothetical protein